MIEKSRRTVVQDTAIGIRSMEAEVKQNGCFSNAHENRLRILDILKFIASVPAY